MHTVYIGLGSNLGVPLDSLKTAIAHLGTEKTSVKRVAGFYRSPPLGPPEQPDYINTVVELQTSHSPATLLQFCKQIEATMGRVKTVRWGARLIDLDILLYDDLRLNEPDLVIPHPEMHKRRFVLKPLSDLAPDLVLPGLNQSVSALQTALSEAPRVDRIA